MRALRILRRIGHPGQLPGCRPSSNTLLSVNTDGLKPGSSSLPQQPRERSPANAELLRHLQSVIAFRGGPISVAEYMSTAISHPTLGYYATKESIGERSDFVTAPEVSQMPGELLGAWLLQVWLSLGAPARVALVELGPGKGTLLSDALRCAQQALPSFFQSAELHLVEQSERMRSKQRQALGTAFVTPVNAAAHSSTSESISESDSDLQGSGVEQGASSNFGNCSVTWHNSLATVPRGVPSLMLAHEFFDALPVHQFEKTSRGWCERLVDTINEQSDDSERATPSVSSPSSEENGTIDDTDSVPLRFVLSPSPTPHSRLLAAKRLRREGILSNDDDSSDRITQLECSPKSMTTVDSIAHRIGEAGGALLAIDYGSEFPSQEKGFTLQAIRDHEFVPLLETAGNADLSAHVDFGALSLAAEESKADVQCFGPVTQLHFFEQLGIGQRADALIRNAQTKEDADRIRSQRKRLTDTSESDMGSQYKVWAIVSSSMPEPPGFWSGT